MINRQVAVCLSIAFFEFSWIGTALPSFASDLSEGIRYYTGGKYSEAVLFLRRETANFPESVTAHYYLANSLSQLHRNREAASEYEKTLQLDPNGTAAKYCRTALKYLSPLASKSGAKESTEEASQGARAPSPSAKAESSKDAATQETAPETAFTREANERVKRINAEADVRVKALEAERDTLLQPYHYGKSGSVNQPASYADPIKADYQKQIDRIRESAKKEADDALAEAKQRSVALEDARKPFNQISARQDRKQ